MGETNKSRYYPSFPNKYKGNPNNIICRSSWERKFCRWCDLNENVLQWGSEEFSIPYVSPLDNRFMVLSRLIVKLRENSGRTKTYVIEVKPKKQTRPPKTPKRQTKSYIYETTEYAKNMASGKSAKEFCDDRRIEFKIITEDELVSSNG